MNLHRIDNGGARGLADWLAMWNHEVLPQLQQMQLIAGGGITLDKYPYGTVVGATPTAAAPAAPAATEAGYSSYFKLTLGSGSGGAAITIADGATGSDSIAVVNGGTTYSLPPYSAAVSGATVYFLQYNPARYDSGGQLVSGATMAISSVAGGILPSGGTSGAYYMQLGRVVGSGAELRAVQDHTAGVAAFNWFVQCNPFTPVS